MTQARRRGEPRAAAASTAAMTIGEVLAVLKPEFPDVTISKLRFLEGAGLVTPDRTAAGYRKFSADDVERLRFVLRTQRDEYLPLRVIRQRLHELERAGGVRAVRKAAGNTARGGQPALQPAEEVTGDEGGGTPTLQPAEATSPAWFGREELCKAAGVDTADLAALESFGLISPQSGGSSGPVYSADDLMILRLAHELSTFGLEPRHLRMYKTFAQREQALFAQVVAPLLRQRNPEARARAQATLDRLTRQCGQLHHAILRNALADATEDPPQ